MSEFSYQVGDSFEGGPIELQKYIHEILSVGGEFEYAGNLVTLTRLPDSVKTVDEIVANTIAAIEAAQPEPVEAPAQPVVEPEPVVEPPAPEPVEEVVAVPVPEVDDELAIAPEPPAPVRRGRKPKAVNAVPVEEK